MNVKVKLEKRLSNQIKNLIKDKTLSDLPPLNSMLNLVKGVNLFKKLTIEEGKKTLIVGDYDMDGMMATTILYGFCQDIGLTKDIVNYIIPSRLVDGYGLSPNIIKYAIENEYEVIVSVDNGIAATEAVKMAKDAGLTVIITDHHTAPAVLPEADVIINPKQPGETFPFKEISGATVAWYFVAQLKESLGLKIDMRKYLDLAGLTVISDVMPMNDINLAIFKFTLKKLKERSRFIYELVWDDNKAPVINETAVGFNLVPMMNAIGRIDNANKGVELFISRDKEFIINTFNEVKEINEERKKRTLIYKNNALNELDVSFNHSQKVIIIKNKTYHEGIVGIIAGKLAEIYKRPAYVFSWSEEKNVWKGSGRSTGDVHLYNLTNKAKEFILGFGGHKGAVGLAVKDEVFENFKRTLEEHAMNIEEELFIDKSLEPIDCELEEISLELLDFIETFGPFGEGNKLPKLRTKAIILPERELSGGLHFSCLAKSNGFKIRAMFFHIRDKNEFIEKIGEGKEVSILFDIQRSYYSKTDTYSCDIFCQLEE